LLLYPGWRSFFSSLFCHALFQSRNFCGTFFISTIDFCLQDSVFELPALFALALLFFQSQGLQVF